MITIILIIIIKIIIAIMIKNNNNNSNNNNNNKLSLKLFYSFCLYARNVLQNFHIQYASYTSPTLSPTGQVFKLLVQHSSFLTPFCSQPDVSRCRTSLQSLHAHLNNNVHETASVLFHFFNFLDNFFFQFISILMMKKT